MKLIKIEKYRKERQKAGIGATTTNLKPNQYIRQIERRIHAMRRWKKGESTDNYLFLHN